MKAGHPQDDLNAVVGLILRTGVVLSSAVIAAGLVLMLLAPPAGTPVTLQGLIDSDFGGPTMSHTALLAGIAQGSAVSILQLGTLILLATPMVRVAASVVIFFRERDMLYVGVTVLVLGMLLFAIFVLGPLEA